MQYINQPDLDDDQLDLQELFRVIWNGKKMIIAFSVSFVIVSLIVASTIPAKYVSSSVLASANPQAGGLPGELSNLRGLASMAGFKAGVSQDETLIAREIIQSWGFIERFIERNNLQIQIYAASGWNKEANSLIIDEGIYDTEKKEWLILGDKGQLRAPTSWELYERFSEMLTVVQVTDGDLTKLSIEYYSPYIAKQWVDLIFQDINSYMQMRKLSRVNSNIEYLEAQVKKTSIADMEQVFHIIIEEQIKSKMLTEATPEHTFVVVNQSMVPEQKAGPKTKFLVTIGALFGFIFSIMIVLIRHSFFSPQSRC